MGGGRIVGACVLLAGVLGCGGNSGGSPPPPQVSTCGGSVTTQGSVGGVTFAADAIDAVGVNGNAITISLYDTRAGATIWFSVTRNPNTNMFAAGAFQDTAVLTRMPPPMNNSVQGPIGVQVSQVTDPFDASGQPIPGPDGGVIGSIAGTFIAHFGNDVITGSFSSPVCSTTVLV